ncbi:hypothetical protein IV417_03265 [Alphaproteobacteria bacterium KMM 3653]|uniref:Uncharacterized protein n=1 Tax=Harenicola maris TaxID=2841044 RepID=A0AAP2CL60_9RHOB|nr:hypothetical protein [Harenicola maris]
MLQTVITQKRRIGFFAGVMTYGFWIMGMLPGTGFVAQAMSFLLALPIMAAVAAAVCLWQPQRRGWLEAICFGVLLGSIIGATTRWDGLIGLPLSILFAAGSVMLLHHDWRRILPFRMTVPLTGAATIATADREVLEMCIPGGDEPMISQRFQDIEEDPDEEGAYMAGWIKSGALAEEATLRLVDIRAPKSANLMIEGEDDQGRISETFLTVRANAIDPFSCRLVLTERRSDMALGEAIEFWFDNAPAEEAQNIARVVAKRPQPEPEAVAPLADAAANKQVDPVDISTLNSVRKAVANS